jgi:hypothetical protein
MATIPQINYGIPAMDYGPLTESLTALGQQVGQTLVAREYQKQAAEALPALQESYKNAFGKISRGEIADGYADILSASMNPSVISNPFLKTFADRAEELARGAGNAVIQQGFQRGGGGGTAAAEPQRDLISAFMGEQPVGEQDYLNPIVEVNLPQRGSAIATPTEEEITGGEINIPEPLAKPESATQERTPMVTAGIKAKERFMALTPQQQQKFDEEVTYTEQELGDRFKIAPVAGLGRFIPGAVGIAIPLPTQEKTLTLRSGNDTLNIKNAVVNEAAQKGPEAASNLARMVSVVEDDPQAMALISRSGGISGVTTKRVGKDAFSLSQVNGKERISIDEDTFAAIDTIKQSRAVGASASLPIVVGRYDFATEEEAKAANLPSGTKIYINGKPAIIRQK